MHKPVHVDLYIYHIIILLREIFVPDGVNEKVIVAFCPFLNTQGAASHPGMVKLLTFTFLSGMSENEVEDT